MPRADGKPGRVLRDLQKDLEAGLLIDNVLVMVPGRHRWRCVYCDRLFDSLGDSVGDPPRTCYGALLAMGERAETRVGAACPECVAQIDQWWDTHQQRG